MPGASQCDACQYGTQIQNRNGIRYSHQHKTDDTYKYKKQIDTAYTIFFIQITGSPQSSNGRNPLQGHDK